MCAWRRVWVNQRNSFYSVFASICFFLSLHTWHDLNIFFFSSLSIPLQCRWSKIRWTYRHRHSRKFYHYAHRPVLLVVHIQCCRECFFPFISLKNKKKRIEKNKMKKKKRLFSFPNIFFTLKRNILFLLRPRRCFRTIWHLLIARTKFNICSTASSMLACLLAHSLTWRFFYYAFAYSRICVGLCVSVGRCLSFDLHHYGST